MDPRTDEWLWLSVAKIIGETKGTCIRRNVGAVLLAEGRLREGGWNGMERDRSWPTCNDGACPRGKLTSWEQPHGSGYSNCLYLHAEYQVAEHYRMSNNIRNQNGWANGRHLVIYVSGTPCEECIQYTERAGIKLIWETVDTNERSLSGERPATDVEVTDWLGPVRKSQ